MLESEHCSLVHLRPFVHGIVRVSPTVESQEPERRYKRKREHRSPVSDTIHLTKKKWEAIQIKVSKNSSKTPLFALPFAFNIKKSAGCSHVSRIPPPRRSRYIENRYGACGTGQTCQRGQQTYRIASSSYPECRNVGNLDVPISGSATKPAGNRHVQREGNDCCAFSSKSEISEGGTKHMDYGAQGP